MVNTNVNVPSTCNFEEVCSEECGGFDENSAESGCSEKDNTKPVCVCASNDELFLQPEKNSTTLRTRLKHMRNM